MTLKLRNGRPIELCKCPTCGTRIYKNAVPEAEDESTSDVDEREKPAGIRYSPNVLQPASTSTAYPPVLERGRTCEHSRPALIELLYNTTTGATLVHCLQCDMSWAPEANHQCQRRAQLREKLLAPADRSKELTQRWGE